jgi:hypothetical protein
MPALAIVRWAVCFVALGVVLYHAIAAVIGSRLTLWGRRDLEGRPAAAVGVMVGVLALGALGLLIWATVLLAGVDWGTAGAPATPMGHSSSPATHSAERRSNSR